MNKLPAYFEKYFEQKFEEIFNNFADLKGHVNDEIQLIRETIQRLEKNQFRIAVAICFLAFLLISHDFIQGSVFGWIIKAFGL